MSITGSNVKALAKVVVGAAIVYPLALIVEFPTVSPILRMFGMSPEAVTIVFSVANALMLLALCFAVGFLTSRNVTSAKMGYAAVAGLALAVALVGTGTLVAVAVSRQSTTVPTGLSAWNLVLCLPLVAVALLGGWVACRRASD